MTYDWLSTFTIKNRFIISNPTPYLKKIYISFFFHNSGEWFDIVFFSGLLLIFSTQFLIFFHFYFFRKDRSILNTVYDKMASVVEGDDGQRRQWTSELYFLLKSIISSVPQFLRQQQQKGASNPLPVTEGSNEHQRGHGCPSSLWASQDPSCSMGEACSLAVRVAKRRAGAELWAAPECASF